MENYIFFFEDCARNVCEVETCGSWQLSPIKLVLQHTSSAFNILKLNLHKILEKEIHLEIGS